MWVFYNYQQLFNLMVILDNCRDFLTFQGFITLNIYNSIWVPTHFISFAYTQLFYLRFIMLSRFPRFYCIHLLITSLDDWLMILVFGLERCWIQLESKDNLTECLRVRIFSLSLQSKHLSPTAKKLYSPRYFWLSAGNLQMRFPSSLQHLP